MMIFFLCSSMIFGSLLLIFSNSPYFGLFGVLLQALVLACSLCYYGAPLFGLLMMLMYVGGMLIVFLFSTVLCAEPYPSLAGLEVVVFWVGLSVLLSPVVFEWFPKVVKGSVISLSSEMALGEVFGVLGLFTCFIAVVLLLALMVVLLLGFEHTNSNLRKL